MASSRRVGAGLALALVTAATTAVSGPATGTPLQAGGHHGEGLASRLGAARDADVHVSRAANGLVRFVGTRAGRPLARPAGVDGHTRPTTAARAFVQQHGALFGVAGPSTALGRGHALATPAGGHVVRFDQQLGGHPVLGGTVSVSLTAANQVAAVAAHTARPIRLEASTQVSPLRAGRAALAATARAEHAPMRQLRLSGAPALTVFEPSLLGLPTAAQPGLVYKVEVVSGPAASPVRELVLVDATSGSVVLHSDELMKDAVDQQTVCTAGRSISVTDPTCPPSGLRTQPTRVDPTSSTDNDVHAAYTNADATFRFYRDVVGDTSALGLPTGAGDRALNSTVHLCDPSSTTVCRPYANAFWDGHEMAYGDGFASADDVVGHELTHSVTEHTSDLLYWYQSGAINESMSDVMGELIDQWDGIGSDGEGSRWVLGEDLPGSVGPARNMKAPASAPAGVVLDKDGTPVYWYPQPDRMSSKYYFEHDALANAAGAQDFNDDNGGVHINSGVGNKAAYLIVDGGVFNGVDVVGLGGADPATRSAAITKAARIYYLTDQLLPSAANYADLYRVLPAACDQLAATATAGITAADCSTVRDAVRATEMDKQPPGATAPTHVPGCGSSATSTDWYDNLENPAAGRWTRSSAHPASGPFYYPQDHNVYDNYPIRYATSGTREIWGDDPDPDGYYNGTSRSLPRDGAVSMSHSVRVPVGKTMYLRFNHAYQFEWYPAGGGYPALFTDGGRVEYSVDGGAWRSAARLFDFGGYNHTLQGLNANADALIYSFRGFGGDSHGYTSARLDLGSLAGRSVRFRFRLTADAAVGAMGWFIDDVRFYTCGARPAMPSPVREAAGHRSVKVTWRVPADHGTSAITRYQVVLKSGTQVLRRATRGASSRAVSFTHLPRGKRLTASVSARNAAGAGPSARSAAVRLR
ncbi:MAG TPA: M4 family metallopeptidase [Marmoricola sp.]